MSNWSESVKERIEEQVREQERINVIEKMIKANASKEQIISYGFTEAEYTQVENFLYVNS